MSNFGLLASLWIFAIGAALFFAAPWLASRIGVDDVTCTKILEGK
ncbi:MAG: hypothetical protein ABGY71_13120 [bacterium]